MSNFSSIHDFGELLVDTVPPTVSSGNVAEDSDNVSNRFLPSSPAKDAKAGLAPRVILVITNIRLLRATTSCFSIGCAGTYLSLTLRRIF